MRAFFPLILLATGCIPRLYTSGPDDSGTPSSEWVAPENDWGVTAPPPGLVGQGWQVGEVPPDFRLLDQFGDEVSLWQFYGQVILVDVSTIWCAPCQLLAEHTEETWDEYRDQGFVYLTLLQQDYEGHPPDQEDLQVWVELYELTSPVLADPDSASMVLDQWPAVFVVGRDLKVASQVEVPEDSEVRRAIEAAL